MPPKTPSKAKKAGSASRSALRVGLHALVVVIAIVAASVARAGGPRLFLWRVARIPAVLERRFLMARIPRVSSGGSRMDFKAIFEVMLKVRFPTSVQNRDF